MSDALGALARAATARPTVVAVESLDGQTLTYETLARRVNALHQALVSAPPVIGIFSTIGADWMVADLAATLAGKTVVPMPEFFSAEQLGHLVRDAGIGQIVTSGPLSPRAAGFDLPVASVGTAEAAGELTLPDGLGDTRHIVYTSGSTGTPKGVRLEYGQIAWSARSLAEAIGATDVDRHLSVLPLSLLLEQICAIHVPLLTGARVVLGDGIAAAARGDLNALSRAAERVRPTTAVLVPELLSGWVAALDMHGQRAPESLRFVAVGGAMVSEALAAAAWACGIPVHEGYGLSECCSVVALNRPGERRAGTVGRPLPGLDVSLGSDGEVIVRGPTVTRGYVGGEPLPSDTAWRTGDLGEFDDAGCLIVRGRMDNLLITGFGRNVSPEWIESMVTADARIAHCILIGNGRAQLAAVLVPRP